MTASSKVLIVCQLNPDTTPELRDSLRDEHIQHVQKYMSSGVTGLGLLHDLETDDVIGGYFIAECDAGVARSFIDSDPYVTGGVWTPDIVAGMETVV